MKIKKNLRNHDYIPESNTELTLLRDGKWYIESDEVYNQVEINNTTFKLKNQLTFTPYASPTKCNAHCKFCSEELIRNNQVNPNGKNIIEDYTTYFNQLENALYDLKDVKNIGLSLSGLEATSDPKWLFLLIASLQKKAPHFDEKVIYTNGTGLIHDFELRKKITDYNFSRIEISRCHFDEKQNQKLMRFNRNENVLHNSSFEKLISEILPQSNIRASCILNKEGISCVDEIEQYLDWLIDLGVKEVVFRELSQIDTRYQNNKFKTWIESNRVSIDPILIQISPNLYSTRNNWNYIHSQAGYYYYNESFTFREKVLVTIETSSYNQLMDKNNDDLINKLVFFPNGNLCGDWDPNNKIIANYG